MNTYLIPRRRPTVRHLAVWQSGPVWRPLCSTRRRLEPVADPERLAPLPLCPGCRVVLSELITAAKRTFAPATNPAAQRVGYEPTKEVPDRVR